jgi:hypothetical protein
MGELESVEGPINWREAFRQNPGSVAEALDDLWTYYTSKGRKPTGDYALMYAAAQDAAITLMVEETEMVLAGRDPAAERRARGELTYEEWLELDEDDEDE